METGFSFKVNRLQRLYRACGIKRKKCKAMPKFNTVHFQAKRAQERKLLLRALDKLESKKYRLFHVDETSFVLRQGQLVYAAPGQYIKSYHFNKFERNRNVIACVGEEGVLCYESYAEHINAEMYLKFLHKIRRHLGSERIGLLHDGASIHKCAPIKNFFHNYRWVNCTSEAWCSYLNPVETFFSMVKRYYYTQRLRIGANPDFNEAGKNLNPIALDQLIEDAFERYRAVSLKKVIQSCMRKWRERLTRASLPETERFSKEIKEEKRNDGYVKEVFR